MEENEIKEIVAKLLKEGESLSNIQDILKNEHGHKMTFLDLRLLASELEDVDWSKGEEEEEKEKSEKDNETVKQGETGLDGEESASGTVVEINKIARPGAIASGTVKFASGASAEWVLDQLGRLGLEKADGQPTPEDLKEFQAELQKAVSQGGL